MRDTATLGLEMYKWWLQRFKHDHHPIPLGHDKSSDLSREKNKVYLRFQGKEYILGFDQEKLEKLPVLFVHTAAKNLMTYDSSLRNVLSNALDYVLGKDGEFSGLNQLSERERKTFQHIFEEPVINLESTVEYATEKYTGLSVRAKIKELPEGRGRGLSENLFIYTQKGILAPIHCVVPQRK
ncbi:MAG: hypothetical protein Q7S74_03940 [Nanoarchaeota archaeon]|nr:hypothetical protein [Nanoarchaeota archaeon]